MKPRLVSIVIYKTSAGLYCHDTVGSHDCGASAVVLVTTVASKRSRYTKRAYHQATLARKLQKMIGYPSTRDFMKIVDAHLLPNCPVTWADIIVAEDIFGPNVDALKG